jgi:hypothetical protein
MNEERLRQVARNLFDSVKIDDPRTLGEKGIGILAFQQLGGRCEIVTGALGSQRTMTLRMVRGRPNAELDLNERRRSRAEHGRRSTCGTSTPTSCGCLPSASSSTTSAAAGTPPSPAATTRSRSSGALLDYLATLVAKEYVVYKNPRSETNELAEEMVRMLVRVRRHMPRRP